MSVTPTSTPSQSTPAAQRPPMSRWAIALLGLLLIFVLVSVLMLITYLGIGIFQAALVISAVAFFPVTYLAFEVRSENHKERLVSGMALLGFGSDEKARLESLYQQIYSPQQFVLFVSLASLSTLLGFGLLYFAQASPAAARLFNLGRGQALFSPVIALTMFYSFLGAYVFSIYNVMRRFMTSDLQPGVYLHVTMLIASVEIVAYIIALGFQDQKLPLLIPGGATEAVNYERWIPIVAFLVGYLPDQGLRFLSTVASRILNFDKRRELRLAEIDGISIWSEMRLRESGIDNVQNMAAADVRKLLLTSRFSVPQVMNWVDQAILQINLPNTAIEPFRRQGLTTMTVLVNLLDQVGADAMPPVKVEGMDEGQIKGVYTAVRAAAETSPNLPYVAAYWKAVKQFDTRQVEAGVQDLLRNQSARLANLDVSNASDAQRLANLVPALNIKPEELEQLFPYEVASLIGLGNLYLSMETRKAYLDAERVLSEAIKLDNNNAPAYAARGLAYFKQGKPAEALKDLEQAQKLDPKYPWTFNNRSLVYAAQREWKKVIAELDQAIALNPTLPIAFLNRGLAHRNDGNLPKASIDLGRAIELAQATGELEILESAYTQLGDLLLEQRSFSEAIDACNRVVRLDRANPLGYLKLGQAYLLASSFQAAVFNLATAADIYENQPGQHDHENLAACYSALAQAYLRLDEPVDVLANVERAAALGDQRPANFKLKGLAHIKLLEEDKAIQALRVYLELLPTAPDRESVQALINDLERKQARSLEKGA